MWIPGSYLVREFAATCRGCRPSQGQRSCPVEHTRQVHAGQCAATAAPRCRLRYEIYAFDTSVRAAFLDARRGFFNGTSLFLRVEGRETEPHRLRIGALPPGWQVATAMPARPRRGADMLGRL